MPNLRPLIHGVDNSGLGGGHGQGKWLTSGELPVLFLHSLLASCNVLEVATVVVGVVRCMLGMLQQLVHVIVVCIIITFHDMP